MNRLINTLGRIALAGWLLRGYYVFGTLIAHTPDETLAWLVAVRLLMAGSVLWLSVTAFLIAIGVYDDEKDAKSK